MSTSPIANTPPTRRFASAMYNASRLFNRYALLLAGTPLLPLYGMLQHRGRRSGKVFRTPVVVQPISGGFIVPMPWGETTDWYRNLRAAGECVIRWKGREYRMVSPEVIDDASKDAPGFNQLERAMMRRVGIHQALRLRFA